MAEQTKVLLVTGDGDYMAATFEASEHTKEETFQKALSIISSHKEDLDLIFNLKK